jgi:hypothetical protein
MKEVRVIVAANPGKLRPLVLDDFSRFKEKVIMINTLKSLVAQADKGSLKAIIEKEGTKMTVKSLRRALETLVDQAIKRVTL